MNKIYFYLPDNLDLPTLLTEHNKQSLIPHIDKFYWFISLLYVVKFVDKRYSDNSDYKDLEHFEKKRVKRQFIPVHSKKIEQIMNSKFMKIIIDALIELNIIEVDVKYQPEQKTKSYRLTRIYHERNFKKVTCKNSQFTIKLLRIRNEEIEKLNPNNKQIYQNMISFFFDLQSAKQILDTIKRPSHSYDVAKISLDKIENNDFFFTVSGKSGRIFHNYCNMKKELRSCLRDTANMPLVEIDIANSQPFFLSMIVKDFGLMGNDVDLYQQLCQDGKLYDYISHKYGLTREKIKKKMWTLFYGKRYYKKHILDEIFLKEFPTVYAVIIKKKNESNSEFAILLQKAEASLMIDTIAPILLEKDIKFITVHDSFLVSQKDVDTVKEIMQNCFEERYGIVPMIRIK
jgi:hypothetical protein